MADVTKAAEFFVKCPRCEGSGTEKWYKCRDCRGKCYVPAVALTATHQRIRDLCEAAIATERDECLYGHRKLEFARAILAELEASCPT